MKFKNKIRITYVSSLFIFTLVFTTGCKKFLDTPLPVDKITSESTFTSDNTISGVVTGIFSNMASSALIGTSGNPESIGNRTALYTDELQNLNTTDFVGNAFYTNTIISNQVTQWTFLYKFVYNSNIAIEGIRNSKALLLNKNQWLGEALFTRAFLYFDLVNLYGDVPLTISSDYQINNSLSRSPKAAVYQQMITDLKEAEGLLTPAFLDGFSVATPNRTRPNRSAASALLARVYLYTGDWANAEAEATKVINTSDFALTPPAQAFLANSKETIWAISPLGGGTVSDFTLYGRAPATAPNLAGLLGFVSSSLSPSLLNLFEQGDTRLTNWAKTTVIPATTTSNGTIIPAKTYYFPFKYKSAVAGAEYLITLRFGEQYLIRAEARTKLNNLSGAITDLNAIRTRAGLGGTSAANQADLISAILVERQKELFTEFGHRFFDLKRTGTIDAVMNVVSPLKGGTWNPQKQIWPIPLGDIRIDPNLTQAPGYN